LKKKKKYDLKHYLYSLNEPIGDYFEKKIDKKNKFYKNSSEYLIKDSLEDLIKDDKKFSER
jgi:hypothetical protein